MKKAFIVALVFVMALPFMMFPVNAETVFSLTQAEYDTWFANYYQRPGDSAADFNSLTNKVQRCQLLFDDNPGPELAAIGYPYYFVKRQPSGSYSGKYNVVMMASKNPFYVYLNAAGYIVIAVDNKTDFIPLYPVMLSLGAYYAGDDFTSVYSADGSTFLYYPENATHDYLATDGRFSTYYAGSSYLSNCDVYKLETSPDGSGGKNYALTDELISAGSSSSSNSGSSSSGSSSDSSGSIISLYGNVVNVLGGANLTDKMREYAYLTGCVLLVVGCWAMIKISEWIFKT